MERRGERPEYHEINKQLARARRLDYRKEEQTLPPTPPKVPTTYEEQKRRVEVDRMLELVQEMEEADAEMSKYLTPQERYEDELEMELEAGKFSRTLTGRINWATTIEPEELDWLQKRDPEFMKPIMEGLKKRPARQAKAERAIQRRGITPGVDHYLPLWERP